VLILDGIQAVATADLQEAAAAALSGTNPEDYQTDTGCSSPTSAAAVLVAGLIALKACQQQGNISGRNSPGRLMRGGSGALGASPINTHEAAGSPDRTLDASPAARRARPFSAPCKGKGREQSASPSVSWWWLIMPSTAQQDAVATHSNSTQALCWLTPHDHHDGEWFASCRWLHQHQQVARAVCTQQLHMPHCNFDMFL
jgi:hypothetical protein